MRNSKGEAEWRALISEQERSGQSAKAFCGERGIALESFYSRRSTLCRSGKREFAAVGSAARVRLEIAGVSVTVAREDLRKIIQMTPSKPRYRFIVINRAKLGNFGGTAT